MPDTVSAPATAPESLRVAGGDGHESSLLLLRATQTTGLLWLPAMGVPARKYRHFAAALAERGWPVALHEWRGQDSSNRRAARDCDWGYATLLQDIAASRVALAQAVPGTRWVIAGHSLGAQLAALALARHPEAYAGYALAGSGQPWWRRFPGWHKAVVLFGIFWFRSVSAVFGYFPGEKAGFASLEARSVMRDWAASASSGDYRPAGIDFDAEARLRELHHPALALRLSSDYYAPKGSLDHLLQKMPDLQLTRDEIANAEFSGGVAGHFDWMREPGPVVERMVSWLERMPR